MKRLKYNFAESQHSTAPVTLIQTVKSCLKKTHFHTPLYTCAVFIYKLTNINYEMTSKSLLAPPGFS